MNPFISIAKITANGDHSGTGFRVSSQYVLTARHVVTDRAGRPYEKITLEFVDERGKIRCKADAKVDEKLTSAEHDFAILDCSSFPREANPLILSDRCKEGADCSSPGFAVQKRSGFVLPGKIASLSEPGGDSLGPALGLSVGRGIRMKGHSGAPVLVEGSVVGLLRTAFLDSKQRTDNSLIQATPIKYVVDHCNAIRRQEKRPELLAYYAPVSWPKALETFEMPLAGRKEELDIFVGMITGQTKQQRALLVSGQSGYGTSAFLQCLVDYARALDVRVTACDLEKGPQLDIIIKQMVAEFSGVFRLTQTAGSNESMEAVLADFTFLNAPFVLAIDAWHKASGDTSTWVERRLIPELERVPGVVLVVAGLSVPKNNSNKWNQLINPISLESIMSVDSWLEYAKNKWRGIDISFGNVQALVLLHAGVPDKVGKELKKLADVLAERSTPVAGKPVPSTAEQETPPLLVPRPEVLASLERRADPPVVETSRTTGPSV